MRISTAVTLTLFAAACGKDPDPVDIIDTPPSAICGNSAIEAGEQCDDGNTADGDGCSAACQTEAAVCSIVNDLGSLTLGTAQMRASGDWFDTPTAGVNMGRKYFVIAARLPPASSNPGSGPDDALIIELGSVGNVFIINQAKNFDLTAGAVANPPTTAYDALASVFGDFVVAGNQLTFEKFYAPRSGSITLTAVGENNGNAIDGSVTATNLAEVDEAGAVVSGGCTSSLGGLTFSLTQMMMAKPGAPGGIVKPGELGTLTRAEIEVLWKAHRARHSSAQ